MNIKLVMLLAITMLIFTGCQAVDKDLSESESISVSEDAISGLNSDLNVNELISYSSAFAFLYVVLSNRQDVTLISIGLSPQLIKANIVTKINIKFIFFIKITPFYSASTVNGMV